MSPGAVEVTAVTDTQGISLPSPQDANAYFAARRAKAGRMVAGVAATVNVPLYKGNGHLGKPMAQRWDDRFTLESSSRKPSSLKGAAKYLKNPGLISLGGGLPLSAYFPFEESSWKVPRIGHFSEDEARETGDVITAGKHDLANDVSAFDISTAFNYGQGTGSAQLLRFITEHTELVHNPPYQDWSCTMTIGSTSALDMLLRMFAQRGDYLLTETYTFSSAVETAAPMGVRAYGVDMDEQGLLATALDDILTTWDPTAHHGARKPFLLYTVPSGQNPTGATQSAQRRRDIYAVAQKHNLLILEDEPYYFLQMQPYTGQGQADAPPPRDHAEFLASLVPSLLSIDTDGRVVRMDSFSKVLAPGSRIGWITASEQIVERYFRHSDVSTQGPCGFSQLAFFKLLDEHWGHAGYLDWLIHLRLEYTRRRDVILGACERYLPREIVSWNAPAAGMFHWMQVDWRKHPRATGPESILQIEQEIYLASIEKGALVIPGSWFYANKDETKHDTLFFRATYAAAPFDKIQEAIRRFGDAVRQEFGVTAHDETANGVNGTKGVNGNA